MMQRVLDRQHQRNLAYRTWSRNGVLVGVDGSTAGAAALGWAAEEAWRRGALLIAACAIRASPSSPSGELDRLRLRTARGLRDAVHAVTGALQAAETLVLEGDPADGLVELSEATELLVLGRASPAGRHCVGGLTRDCLLRASCPVVLVPEQAAENLGTLKSGP